MYRKNARWGSGRLEALISHHAGRGLFMAEINAGPTATK